MIFLVTKINTIGDLLKSVHLEKINEHGPKFSQSDLARWFNIDPIIFNKYYNDKRLPDAEASAKLAKKLGPVVYKLTGRIPPDIWSRINKVPPDKLDELEQVIDDFLSSLDNAG
jgi:hypothetical protein